MRKKKQNQEEKSSIRTFLFSFWPTKEDSASSEELLLGEENQMKKQAC